MSSIRIIAIQDIGVSGILYSLKKYDSTII